VQRKPWWFVTFFATLSVLSILTFELPKPILITTLILSAITVAVSLAFLIYSIANRVEKSILELNILFVVFGAAFFFGSITLQASAIQKYVTIPPLPLISQLEPQPVEEDVSDTQPPFKLIDGALEVSQMVLLVFVIIGAFVGIIFNADKPIGGAILGGVGGGLVGVVLGPFVTVLIDNGLIGFHRFFQ
jgi:hypothetical protein